jgi:hypothetical protein
MISKQQFPISHLVGQLENVSAEVGLTQQDIAHLLSSGLGVDQLLDYAEAMLFNRMN